METLPAALTSFMESPGGQALAVLYVLAIADLIVSSAVAIQKGIFQMSLVDSWVRTNLSKVVIVTTALVGGHILGGLRIEGLADLPGTAMTLGGLSGAAAYALAVIASLTEAARGQAKVPTE